MSIPLHVRLADLARDVRPVDEEASKRIECLAILFEGEFRIGQASESERVLSLLGAKEGNCGRSPNHVTD